MQINKNIIIIGLSIVILIMSYFLFQPKDIKTVEVPIVIEVPVPGKISTFPPIELPKPKIAKPRPDLKNTFVNSDSITKDSLYNDAITERSYDLEFKDSIQSIKTKTTVLGKMLSQSLEYEIYPSVVKLDTVVTIDVPVKTNFYGHLEIGSQLNELKPVLKANIIIKSKKNKLYSIGYDTNNNAWFGGSIKF